MLNASTHLKKRLSKLLRPRGPSEPVPADAEAAEAKAEEAAEGKVSLPYSRRVLQNMLPYSYYAYGLYHAARLAKELQIPKISAIEFGVAGGNGLLQMEKHAAKVGKLMGVEVEVYGFDTGEGMTPPQDYRDMPYRFAQGNYKMDVPKLKARLSRAELVLGDVKQTVPAFLETRKPAPIGFVSFDLDYYSSTMDAFVMFNEGNDSSHFLPRLYCYFDDIIGSEISSYTEFVGELLAIKDFNEQNKSVKLAESRVFRNYPQNFPWFHQIYVMHRFTHPRYGDYVSKAGPRSLALR